MQTYVIYHGALNDTYNLYYIDSFFGELLINEYELDTPIQQVYDDILDINEQQGITNEKIKVILNI